MGAMVESETNNGRIVFFSDSSIFINEMWDRYNNSEYNLALVESLIGSHGTVIFDEKSYGEETRIRHSKFQESYIDDIIIDSDGDMLPDEWELRYHLNLYNASDAVEDEDNDGWDVDRDGKILGGSNNETYTNLEEYYMGTDPTNNDTHGDGICDGFEVYFRLNPLLNDSSIDSDNDSYNAYRAQWGLGPVEGGNYSNIMEYAQGDDWTNPMSNDTDEDGMWDGWERFYDLNPIDSADAAEDADGGGTTNLDEFNRNLNPRDSEDDET